MRRIDKLYMKALKIRPSYDDICIITNESGRWKIEGREFSTLEAAEQAARKEYGREDDDLLIIINDAGPGDISKEQVEYHGRDKIEDKNPCGYKEDDHKSDEHDSKRKDGRKNSKYNNFWV